MVNREVLPSTHALNKQLGFVATQWGGFRFLCRDVASYEYEGQVWAPRFAVAIFDAVAEDSDSATLDIIDALFEVLAPAPLEVANRFVLDLDELRAVLALSGREGVCALVAERVTPV